MPQYPPARVYGHIYSGDGLLFIPNASVQVTCNMNNLSAYGAADEQGYYIIEVPCRNETNVTVKAASGPITVCLSGNSLCVNYAGGYGSAIGNISSAGYKIINVLLTKSHSTTTTTTSTTTTTLKESLVEGVVYVEGTDIYVPNASIRITCDGVSQLKRLTENFFGSADDKGFFSIYVTCQAYSNVTVYASSGPVNLSANGSIIRYAGGNGSVKATLDANGYAYVRLYLYPGIPVTTTSTTSTTTSTTIPGEATVYGHVHVEGTPYMVPNATVRATCQNKSSPATLQPKCVGSTDENGYYILKLACPEGANVTVSSESGPVEICLNGTCVPYLGGEGNATGKISDAGYAKVDVPMNMMNGTTTSTISTTTSTIPDTEPTTTSTCTTTTTTETTEPSTSTTTTTQATTQPATSTTTTCTSTTSGGTTSTSTTTEASTQPATSTTEAATTTTTTTTTTGQGTTTTPAPGTQQVKGHVYVKCEGTLVPNASVSVKCRTTKKWYYGKADESGYYSIDMDCPENTRVKVKASSGPIEICKGKNCTQYAGGKGKSSGKLNGIGQAYVKVALKPINAGNTKDAESETDCELYGDEESCGDISIPEIVDTINQWTEDEAMLEDIVDLINAWGNF
jgi:hypothetical protein